MFVCICHGVTDNTINKTVANGATTMRCLSNQLNIGKQCGKCIKTAKKVLDTQLKITNVAA
jgi:bacterioferritin-associated ferredoxin